MAFLGQAGRILPALGKRVGQICRGVVNNVVRWILAKICETHPDQKVKIEKKQNGAHGNGDQVGAAKFAEEADYEKLA